MKHRTAFISVLLFFLAAPLSVMAYKLYVLDYPLAGLIPTVSYRVDLSMQVDGHGEDVSVVTSVPRTDMRQTITEEQNSSEALQLSLVTEGENRIATWKAENLQGTHDILYSYQVQGRHIRYRIPEDMQIPASYPAELAPYLAAEPGIQMNDPLVAAELRTIIPEEHPTVLSALTRIHRHLQDRFKNRDFSGYTDAVTALKLGEASCNGKSRLFAALARKLNLPARLVGGLILKQGSKRVTHQWVEVFVGGHWVPFDTINDRMAEIPQNYLTLYYGDLVLFKHTANVNFRYVFKMTKRLVPRRDALESMSTSRLNIFNFYRIFDRLGISQNLLKIILMLPLGSLVVVIFRNVIGIQTYGTFLPALIAAAARETGLLWGIIGFTAVILFASLVRKGLDWMQLLHSPKMGVMFTFVVMALLLITLAGAQSGLLELAHMTLFPIAILAITAERFALIEAEQSFKKALGILAASLVVVSACYAVMGSLFLQSMVLAFPELLLVVIALHLWLGKWMGMRLAEFIRFRRLVFGGER